MSFLQLRPLLDRPLRVWTLGAAALHLLERVLLVLGAVQLARQEIHGTLVLGLALASFAALRGFVASVLRGRARSRLILKAAESLVQGDVLRATPLPSADPEMALFEALYEGERLIARTVPALIGDAFAVVIVAAVMIATLPVRLVIVGTFALAVAAIGLLVARHLTSAAQKAENAAYTPVMEGLLAALGGRLELAATARDQEFLEDLGVHADRLARAATRADRVSGGAGRIPMLLAALGVGAALLFEQLGREGFSLAVLGQAALFAAAVPPFAGLARGALDATRGFSRLAALRTLFEGAQGRTRAGKAPPPALPAPVAVDGLSFAYPNAGSTLALSNLSFSWHPGEVLVLTGPNGSGKSTLLRLLLGLAEPSAGSIRVAGSDLRAIDGVAWRRRVAFLPQRPFLSERATVRDAVRLLARDADDARIEAALDRAGLLAALRAHPASPLDVRVGTLSVGQRQRLGLARVLLLDAPILLLDEPDANLDVAGVALVRDLVLSLAKTRMIALAAHTEQLVDVGDRVIRLAPGGIMAGERPDSARLRVASAPSS